MSGIRWIALSDQVNSLRKVGGRGRKPFCREGLPPPQTILHHLRSWLRLTSRWGRAIVGRRMREARD